MQRDCFTIFVALKDQDETLDKRVWGWGRGVGWGWRGGMHQSAVKSFCS